MNRIRVILAVSFLFITSFSCRTQMVQTVSDAKKLEINEKRFIGHPLKALLKEIKPEIKMATISPGGGETNSFFVFHFLDKLTYYKNLEEKKEPTSIKVYTKEYIQWDSSDRRKAWWKWDANDVKKYSNLTVGAIRVSGSD